MAQLSLVGQGHLITEASRSHSDTPRSLELTLCDQPDSETSTCTAHNNHKVTDIHAPGGIRTHIPSKRVTADPRLRRRGHWDWHTVYVD